MKLSAAIMALLVFVLLFTSVSWAEDPVTDTTSQVSATSAAALEPVVKGSSGGRSSSSSSSKSSSSSSKKIKDGDDDDTVGNDTSSSGGFPWWIFAIGIIIILGIIGLVIWLIFLRK